MRPVEVRPGEVRVVAPGPGGDDAPVIESASGWYVTPTSVKAVVFDDGGQVLLGLNPSGHWELPGGWPEPGDASLEETARREVAEESGLDVRVAGLVTACLHRGAGGVDPVALVVLAATVEPGAAPVASEEHSSMAFFPAGALPQPLAASYRQAIALAVRQRATSSTM